MPESRRRSSSTAASRTRCCSKFSPQGVQARSFIANIKHRPSGRRPSLYFMLLQILSILLNILWWIIIAQAVMSWLLAFNVINTHNEFVRQLWYVLERITEPDRKRVGWGKSG